MIIKDQEFGEVIVRKNPLVKGVRFSVSTSGRLQMSVPKYVGSFLAKRFLESNRELVRSKLPVKDPKTQRARDAKKRILTKKAKEYLPYRLEYLAKRYGYKYDKCRLTYANTRWGSCSSNRTISLNIGLMQVPETTLSAKAQVLKAIKSFSSLSPTNTRLPSTEPDSISPLPKHRNSGISTRA